jgi:hypothetical protein
MSGRSNYFVNERELRDAVMHRLEEEAGIDLAGLRLENVADAAARIFEHVPRIPLSRAGPLDPTLTEAQRKGAAARTAAVAGGGLRRRLRRCSTCFGVSRRTSAWWWDWQLDREQAIRGIGWVIQLTGRESGREGAAPKLNAAPGLTRLLRGVQRLGIVPNSAKWVLVPEPPD